MNSEPMIMRSRSAPPRVRKYFRLLQPLRELYMPNTVQGLHTVSPVTENPHTPTATKASTAYFRRFSHLVHVNDGISSSEKSCTVKYDIDKVFGKECKCVVTDALGNTVESESDKIRYCYHGTDPLVKYTPSGYSSPAYVYSMNDDYYITAYFQGGSCAWRQYKARINILTEENGKRQFKEFDNIYYTGTNKFHFVGNRLEYTGKKSAMQKEGLINTLNNCQVVITDPLTNVTLSYLLTLE
jgi:hypothetical protein